MLKLCPLFLEGASLYAEATTTNYMDHVLLLSCEDSIAGSGSGAWGRDTSLSETGSWTRSEDESTTDIMVKKYLLFLHNAQCFLVPIIPKIYTSIIRPTLHLTLFPLFGEDLGTRLGQQLKYTKKYRCTPSRSGTTRRHMGHEVFHVSIGAVY